MHKDLWFYNCGNILHPLHLKPYIQLPTNVMTQRKNPLYCGQSVNCHL